MPYETSKIQLAMLFTASCAYEAAWQFGVRGIDVSVPQRPILRYFGGKWLLAPWIISHFPSHRVYVEPFGGGASVLLRKSSAELEVYNDLNGEIVNVFRVLQKRDDANELARRMLVTPWARQEFEISHDLSDDAIDQARRTIIRSFIGYGSNGANRRTNRTGFRQRVDLDFGEYSDAIKSFTDRLGAVVIENKPYQDLISDLDAIDALFFFDPPYVHETREHISNGRYVHEMTDAEHIEMCDRISAIKGSVVLCGYENSIYARLGWQTLKRETHADRGADRTEVLWFNDRAWQNQSQASFAI